MALGTARLVFVNILIFIVRKDKIKSGGHRRSWAGHCAWLTPIGGGPQNRINKNIIQSSFYQKVLNDHIFKVRKRSHDFQWLFGGFLVCF